MRAAVVVAWLACAVAACAGEPASPATPTAHEVEVRRLGRLLLGRHGVAPITARHGTAEALIEISRTDPRLVVRVRAVLALAGHPGAAQRARLLELLDERSHPSMRAAAVRAALAGSPTSDSSLGRALAALAGDPDPRVRAALAAAVPPPR